MTTETKVNDFGWSFVRLTFVNIISNIMVPLAGLVDVAFLGHLSDIRHLAGVALATILFDYLYRSCKFLRMGTTGATAQAEGRADAEVVLLTLLRNCFIAVILAGIILLLQYPVRELGFTILSAASDVKDAGREYYNARIWGAPAALCNFVLIGWFLGRSQNHQVLLMSTVGNLANIVLDYLFIIRWGWESAGAGGATAISQYLMLLLGIILMAREGCFRQVPAVAQQFFDWEAMKATFSMNLDIWIRTLASVTLFAIFINLSGVMGTVVLASNSLMVEVVSLAVFLIEGSSFATETLAGLFYVTGQTEKLVSLLRLSGGISLGLGLAFGSLFIIFPDFMFGLLTNHLEVIDQIERYVFWLLPILVVLSLVYVLEGYFMGLTQMSTIRNSMVMAIALGFLPLAVVAWQLHNVHLLWLSLLLFMVTRAIALTLYVPSTLKGDVGDLTATTTLTS